MFRNFLIFFAAAILVRKSLADTCAGGYYNPRDMMCCGGNLHLRLPGWLCCGSTRYNPLIQICWQDDNGYVYPRSWGMNSSYPLQMQNSNWTNNGFMGGIGVNTNNNLPNYPQPQSWTMPPPSYSFCEGVPYDPMNFTCCDGLVNPRTTGGNQCCGRVAYDPGTELCIRNRIYPRYGTTTWPSTTTNSSWFLLLNNSSMPTTGLTSTVALPSSVTWWSTAGLPHIYGGDNEPYLEFPVCGGKEKFNPQFHMCCSGQVIYTKASDTTVCCGNTTYDPFTELCCQGGYVFERSDYDACCNSTGYDTMNSACCGGWVLPRSPVTDECPPNWMSIIAMQHPSNQMVNLRPGTGTGLAWEEQY